jgi:hypothetical protein
MTVVQSFEGFCDCFKENSCCSKCGNKLMPPFLMYCGGGDGLFLCGPCAYNIRKGLTADLIQLSAIVELREIYPGRTLVRRDSEQIEAEERERWRRLRPKPAGVVELFPPDDGGDAA